MAGLASRPKKNQSSKISMRSSLMIETQSTLIRTLELASDRHAISVSADGPPSEFEIAPHAAVITSLYQYQKYLH